MSIREVLTCDFCAAQADLGPPTMDWIIYFNLSGAMFLARMFSNVIVPDQWRGARQHLCKACFEKRFPGISLLGSTAPWIAEASREL